MPLGLFAQSPKPIDLKMYNALFTGHSPTIPAQSSEPFHLYISAYSEFIQTATYSTDRTYSSYFDSISEIREGLPDDNEAWTTYFLAEIKLQEAFIEMKAGNEISAAWKFRQAYRMTQQSLEKFPEFTPFYKTLGVMECLLGAIPDNMQWVPSLFGMEGSVQNGIQHLKEAGKNSVWLRQETDLLLALCFSYLLNSDEDALHYTQKVINNSKNSPLQTYLAMNILLRSHRAQDALLLYERLPDKSKDYLPLLYYLAGNALLQIGEYQKSILALENFITFYKGEDFVKDSYYKKGIAMLLLSNVTGTKEMFQSVQTLGSANTEADRYAEAHSTPESLPHPILMKLRLYTDGGLYENAKQVIQNEENFEFVTPEEKTEFTYRTARLAHLTGDSTLAIVRYKKTLEEQGANKWYFAPNSCLQLGYLFLEKDKNTSEEYFLKVSDYKGYDYEKGIQRKAEAALNRYF